MDGDAIGITAFAVVAFGAFAALVLWARARELKRRYALQTMMQAIGFAPITAPPADFPLEKFPLVRWGEKGGRTLSQAGRGVSSGRDVLFFDYFLVQEQGYKNLVTTVAETVIAARGGPECFPSEKNDPTLQLESMEGWTIVYKIRTSPAAAIMTADEIQALILAIPAPGFR